MRRPSRSTVLAAGAGPWRGQRTHARVGATLVAMLGVLGANVLSAQEREPRPAAQVGSPSSHRFFDLTNVTLTGIESTALLADGIYTQRGLTRYPEVFREADPLARPFVSRGWPGQIAGGVLVVSADVGLRYLLHRKDRHRLERFVPLVLTVYGALGAIHNAREIKRYERSIRP